MERPAGTLVAAASQLDKIMSECHGITQRLESAALRLGHTRPQAVPAGGGDNRAARALGNVAGSQNPPTLEQRQEELVHTANELMIRLRGLAEHLDEKV